MSTEISKLPTVAALHTLLATHPELVTLPIRWSVEPDGALHASPTYLAEGSHDAVRALAAAVGAETYEYMTTSPETGEAFRGLAVLSGRFAGREVFSVGYELAPTEVAAAVGGVR